MSEDEEVYTSYEVGDRVRMDAAAPDIGLVGIVREARTYKTEVGQNQELTVAWITVLGLDVATTKEYAQDVRLVGKWTAHYEVDVAREQ